MGNVFANAMQISSKSMSGKSICQFPDVCFTPPQTPATPPGVPIPYPNTGMASDTTEGSRSVKIGGSEVMLKNRSSFKQSTGDEAGSAPKKGLINSKNKGKVYFIAWSMDVKIEGENVVRHLDMTTHNHACDPANGAMPTVHAASNALEDFKTNCGGDKKKIEDNCTDDEKDQCPGMLAARVGRQRTLFKGVPGASPTEHAAAQATSDAEANDCVRAMRCFLRPHSPEKDQAACCPGQTPHHIPPKSCFKNKSGKYISNYKPDSALCVCLEGASQYFGSHGKGHAAIDHLAKVKLGLEHEKTCPLGDYNKICAAAVAEQCGCNALCIEDQLNASLASVKPQQVTHKKIGNEQLTGAEKTKLNQKFDKVPKKQKAF